MKMLSEFIFWAAWGLLAYSYAFYPFLLRLLGRRKRHVPALADADLPGISIVIAAYNEEKVIAARLENCLTLDYPADRREIILAIDGADDKTAEIARRYQEQGVTVLDFAQRRGKVNVLNDAVPSARHDIIVFSDANTFFERDAVRVLVRHFTDPKVGSVCGRLKFVNAMGSRTAELEGVYWRFETFLKTVEGSRGSLLGANGGIYAIRKALFQPCPPETIVDDFLIPMRILEQGYETVYEPEASAVEEAARHIVHEKKRRIRIGAGDFQALFWLLPMLHPRRGFPALAFWSHKVLRWFAPFFLIAMAASNLALHTHPFYRWVLAGQGLFYAAAFIGQALNWSGIQVKVFSLCYYFVSMNTALLLGFFRFLMGRQKAAWERTER